MSSAFGKFFLKQETLTINVKIDKLSYIKMKTSVHKNTIKQ